jgi:hypothetical protein
MLIPIKLFLIDRKQNEKQEESIKDELSFNKFSFCLPFGKADATPSSVLPRARGRRLQRRPWTP